MKKGLLLLEPLWVSLGLREYRIRTDYPWGELDVKQPHRVTWAKRPIEGTEEHAYAAGIIDSLGHAILMQTTAL